MAIDCKASGNSIMAEGNYSVVDLARSWAVAAKCGPLRFERTYARYRAVLLGTGYQVG